jgi:hypothetical protein
VKPRIRTAERAIPAMPNRRFWNMGEGNMPG